MYNLPNHLREFFYYLERHGHTTINTITTSLIQTYYQELTDRGNQRRGGGLSKAFLNKHQQALKRFVVYLKEHNSHITFSAHLQTEKLNYHKSEKVLVSQEEIKEMFEACNFSHMNEHFQKRDRAILVLLYSCGLRRNEAIHVNTEDI